MISFGGETEGMYTYWLRKEPEVAESVVLLPLKCARGYETNMHGLAICPFIADDRYERVACPDPSVPSVTIGYGSGGQ
jgi:hypothetical protein